MGYCHDNPALIKQFNDKYLECNINNTEIEDNTDYCILHNIGQEGFKLFCLIKLPCISYLCLSNNNISDITFFKYFKAPYLVKLDLSYNLIQEIDIFEKILYPLEYLDLSNNRINNINIFKNESILKNLNFISLKNNDINFNDENNKNIMKEINKRMKKNIKKDSSDEDESEIIDDSFKIMLDRVKTINDKLKSDLYIFDKHLIKRMKTLQVDKDLVNEIEELNKNLKISINKNISRSKTYKYSNRK